MEISNVFRLSSLVQCDNAYPSTFSAAWENWHVCITHGSSMYNLYLRGVAPGDPLAWNVLCITNTKQFKITIEHRLSYTRFALKAWRICSTFCCDSWCFFPPLPTPADICRNVVYGLKLLPVRTDLTSCSSMMWYTIVELPEIYQHVIGTCFSFSNYESNRCSLIFVNFNQPMQYNNRAEYYL